MLQKTKKLFFWSPVTGGRGGKFGDVSESQKMCFFVPIYELRKKNKTSFSRFRRHRVGVEEATLKLSPADIIFFQAFLT